jgi:1-acyl-sn-glycerol-3-phosphate acyltransferase
MKWGKALLGWAWKIYFLLVTVITLLILYPAYLILLLNERFLEAGFHLTRFQAKLILKLVGIRKTVHGSIPNDETQCYIICPNHSSYVDILMLYAVFPHYFIFLGKQELGRIPLFNIFFKKLNILVDRKNPRAGHHAIIKACQRMEQGTNVVIFPEGTIPETVPRLKPFKNGAFKAALQLNIPIVPVTFKGNHRILEDKWHFTAHSWPGRSEVFIHPPISVKDKSAEDLITLREQTKAAIASKL